MIITLKFLNFEKTMKMKKIFIILCLIGLAINSYSQRGGAEYDYLKVRKELSVYGDTTLREYIEEHAPSGTARDAGSGTSLDGNDLDWNGTLDKDVEISGAGNSVEIGTDASKVTNFLVKASTGASFEAPYIGFNAGIEWNLVDEYWISENGDTLSDRDVVRELILESKNTLPFNFDYTFNSSIIDSRPGIGYFKFNYKTLSSVTEIYIDYFDQNTISQNVFLSAADSGSYIAIQSSTNNYALYQLNGGYIDNGNYYTYKVEYIGHNGVISGSSVLDLNVSNNTGGGSAATGSDSTLISSTDTITLSNGILDGSGVDAKFDNVEGDSVKTSLITDNGSGSIEIEADDLSLKGNSSYMTSDDLVRLRRGGNLPGDVNALTVLLADRNIELKNQDAISPFSYSKTVIDTQNIYMLFDPNGSVSTDTSFNFSKTALIAPTVAVSLKTLTATENVEADSVKATNITSDSQTIGDITATGFTSSKDAMEGTVTDSLTSGQFILSELNTAPSQPSDTGTTGEIRITSTYIYVCIAIDTWVRASLSTW